MTMSLPFRSCAMACMLLGTSGVAFAQSMVPRPVSESKAQSLVRAFEGTHSLAVRVNSRPLPHMLLDPSQLYTFEAGHYHYQLPAASTGVFIRTDQTFIMDQARFYGQKPDPDVLKLQAMSQEDARK